MTDTIRRASAAGVAPTRRPAKGRIAWLASGVGVLAILFWLSVAFGTRNVALGDVFAALSGDVDNLSQAADSSRPPADPDQRPPDTLSMAPVT